MDSDDQVRLIRRLLKSLELDENEWVPKELGVVHQRAKGRWPACEVI